MFNYKNEQWQVKSVDGKYVYASRPGKRGRPSKFLLDDLLTAGVDVSALTAGTSATQDEPVLDTNVETDEQLLPESAEVQEEFPF